MDPTPTPAFCLLLTLAEGDGFTPQVVALGVPGANGHALSHQAVASVAAKVDGASGLSAGLAQDEAVEWSPRQAAVRGCTQEGFRGTIICQEDIVYHAYPVPFSSPPPSPLSSGCCEGRCESIREAKTKHDTGR